ncbi:MAG: hypothetical protein KDA28_13510, partial [Phycisphaerales bacterium]|nr:hypothetical protein [Phycisphaerales bacterium]
MRTCAVLLFASVCLGQAGDRKGEDQPPLPEDLQVPPAPVLDVEDALASFTIEDGFRIDAVAFEPFVEDPVAMEIDARGRFWVVEMRGYMPNIDGTDELEPVGRISILEDTDGDGVMDRSTAFLDDLVLPRAICLTEDGALVVEPPHLLLCRDLDGDDRADTKEILASGFKGLDSPEHAGNGLMRSIDNWIYCSQHPLRFRFDGIALISEPTPGHGQWGLTMDDEGRNYVSYNSSPVHIDLYPQH